jgi:hypothetical protein
VVQDYLDTLVGDEYRRAILYKVPWIMMSCSYRMHFDKRFCTVFNIGAIFVHKGQAFPKNSLCCDHASHVHGYYSGTDSHRGAIALGYRIM